MGKFKDASAGKPKADPLSGVKNGGITKHSNSPAAKIKATAKETAKKAINGKKKKPVSDSSSEEESDEEDEESEDSESSGSESEVDEKKSSTVAPVGKTSNAKSDSDSESDPESDSETGFAVNRNGVPAKDDSESSESSASSDDDDEDEEDEEDVKVAKPTKANGLNGHAKADASVRRLCDFFF